MLSCILSPGLQLEKRNFKDRVGGNSFLRRKNEMKSLGHLPLKQSTGEARVIREGSCRSLVIKGEGAFDRLRGKKQATEN